ncbi:response regulator transcription factor [Schaalia odontolytica]|uniref:Transcriptional activator protein CopR n=1 Tax=Schaalia odontolytica TaxID=1660 RepID=A0A2X0VLT2_9ACTO|nr:response regulator transcription factor [Schaalia odontolytica]WMS27724.1 response regulator transcription factor [Schaalia odontolytica]SPT54741.1 Transcriptional activator protein CopR [Schaalia odontolytica]
MTTILIVEDEQRIAAFVAKGLRSAGFVPEIYSTGSEAVEAALQGRGALMLLDVGLPDIDGFEVLEQIRGQGVAMPVIMLTARSSVADRVAGLEGGADDYVPKPFSFEELLARVRLRLREETVTAGSMALERGELILDLKTRRARVGQEWVDLSAREFTLLETFMRNAGQVLSREQLLSAVWGIDFDGASNVVDVYLSYLRQKIGKDHFETVRGMGYRLV